MDVREEWMKYLSETSVLDMGGSDDCLDPKYWKGDPFMDVEKWEDPKPEQIKDYVKKQYKIDETNEPDEWVMGLPCFYIDENEFCNFLNGRKIHWKWLKQTKNEKIKNFVRKNSKATFFVKINGKDEYYKIYMPKSVRGKKMAERQYINVMEDGNKVIIEFKEREGFNAFMKGLKENRLYWNHHPHTKEMMEELTKLTKHRYVFVKYGNFYCPLR